MSLGWWVFCFYTLRTHKVIHLISKEAQLLIYNADNDARHPLSGIIPSFCWEHCSSTKWLGIKKGIHIFQVFCQLAILLRKKYFDFFFSFSSGRLNSEGFFAVVKSCISKWNQITLPNTHASSELTPRKPHPLGHFSPHGPPACSGCESSASLRWPYFF